MSKSPEELVESLKAFPQLYKRVEQLLDIVENKDRKYILGDDAEEAVIAGMNGLGPDLLGAWCEKESKVQAQIFEERHKGVRKNGKKKSTGTRGKG
jgi:hypothetical protein